MALALLNGSQSTIDVSLDATSIKCIAGRWFAQIVRGATSATTFCNNGWVAETPGSLQLIGRIDAFASKGVAYSDPLLYVTKATAVAFILTADTGVTLTFSGHVYEDSMEVVAAANQGRSIGFRSTGAVVSAGFTS